VAALAAACGAEAGDSVSPSAGEDLSGAEVLAELRDSVALIETPAGSGSAVLLPDGYLLTNAHVVDPFTVVDVTFEGAETTAEVPVVGIDLVADLAVVGPVTTDREPTTIADPLLLEPGSDVYLVGFPGDQREQEVTLAGGVVSRTRSADPWGIEYLQTDTTSGGALVDTSGRVVGISGLEDADGFAYSLSGADVLARLDDLLEGGERDWEPSPFGSKATEFTATPQEFWPTALYLPHAAEDGELSVTVPEGTGVAFTEPGYLHYPLAVDEAGAEVPDVAYWSTIDVEVYESDGGTVTSDVYAGSDAVVLNRMDDWSLYELELDAGETVEIAVSAA
jgi:S1-C subfamily serine protease